MKKRLLILTLAAMAFCVGSAQLLQVRSMEKVRLPEGVCAAQAVLSPDGTKIAIANFDGTLQMVDRNSDVVKTISHTGSMMDLAFTADGSGIIYRESTTDASHRRFVSVKSYNTATGATATLVSPTRNLQALEVRGNAVTTIDAGRASALTVAPAENRAVAATLDSRAVPSIDRGRLYITVNGERRLLSPLGTSGMSYLWASVSPDGNRVLFYAAAYGTYTCRLDGSDLVKIGKLLAPVWYDNELVVGMQTREDGHMTTEGRIVAASIDGAATQVLTEPVLIAVLPSAQPGKISFSTTDGEVYILNVSK